MEEGIIDTAKLNEFAPIVEHKEQEHNAEHKTENPKIETPKIDLSGIKPLIHRLHKIGIDVLGYQPDDDLIQGLDDEAIKCIQIYAPQLIKYEKFAPVVSYAGMWGLILMASKKKGETESELERMEKQEQHKQAQETAKDTEFEEKPNE